MAYSAAAELKFSGTISAAGMEMSNSSLRAEMVERMSKLVVVDEGGAVLEIDVLLDVLQQLDELLEGHVHARLLYFRSASAFLSILPFFVSGMASICLMALGTMKEGSSACRLSASASFSIEPT